MYDFCEVKHFAGLKIFRGNMVVILAKHFFDILRFSYSNLFSVPSF